MVKNYDKSSIWLSISYLYSSISYFSSSKASARSLKVAILKI